MMQRPYFSKNYSEGRARFLKMCLAKNLGVQTFIHPDHQGPIGEALAMDCAWIGPSGAEKVLLITCGTHGLEAAAGAATILQFMDNELYDNLEPKLGILIVHAVNPYGWAHDRRGNEDGIDLNRNCLDHEHAYPQNHDYDALHSIIKNAIVNEAGLKAFTSAFHQYGKTNGREAAINGITAGQYSYPNGMSYGGAALSWSCQTLFEITKQYLKCAQKIIHIDWHTGIGDFGQPFFITDDQASSAEYKLASKWWSPHKIHADDILEGGAPHYTGLLVKGLKEQITAISQANVVSVVVEWGTYDLDKMLQALLMDDWLKANMLKDTPFVQNVREQLIDRFFPSAPQWRQAVLSKAQPIYQQALFGLASW